MILVVEDDLHLSRLIALMLKRNGFDSQVVADGESALSRALSAKPAMIFADLTIKGMDGEQLCSTLKSNPETRNIPYVVISGDPDIADKAHSCGADAYMGKPFELDDLILLVKKYARAQS
jgi:CheY-like chemotaxis protein